MLCDSQENCQAAGEYINLSSLSVLQSSGKKLGDGLFGDRCRVFDQTIDGRNGKAMKRIWWLKESDKW